jgi:multiple sugar transport system substrate-binding protein
MIFKKNASRIAKYIKHQLQPYQSLIVVPKQIRRCQGLRLCYIFMALIALSLLFFACTNTSKSDHSLITESSSQGKVLNIWWDKGFTLEEDEALAQLISRWERQTGNKVKVSFYNDDELPQKAKRSLRAGNPPDIIVSYKTGSSLSPKLAWEGKLADVSDVIAPVKSQYPKAVLESVYLYNNIDKKWSYYAVPIYQITMHIFYWRDLLKQVGRSENDIPKDWDAFWEFWKQVQYDLRKQQKRDIYGLGFPLSIGAVDTYYLFEEILEAYDVKILNSKGQLQVDDSRVSQGITKSLDWYTKFYLQGYVPPNAVHWLNPDNNRNLLNHIVVMTPNPTLSIPAAVYQEPDIYHNKLGILEFPHKPNGKPMRHIVTVGELILLAESKSQNMAKDFLAYLLQPQALGNYLKASRRGNFPVLNSLWKDPFWTNPNDPHISTAAKTFINGQTRLFYTAQNPSYSEVLEENVWGKALNRIVVDGISPKQATDEAIQHIKQIFDHW